MIMYAAAAAHFSMNISSMLYDTKDSHTIHAVVKLSMMPFNPECDTKDNTILHLLRISVPDCVFATLLLVNVGDLSRAGVNVTYKVTDRCRRRYSAVEVLGHL